MAAEHHILLYDYVENMVERRVPFRDAHIAHIQEYKADGRVIMAGALGNPPHGGAIVFRGVEPAVIERFVETDPYNEAGLIVSSRIEPWAVT